MLVVSRYRAREMDSVTYGPVKPLGSTPKRMFNRRIGEGISQPPWSWRAGVLAVLAAFAGFLGLPVLFAAATSCGLPDLNGFWPNLFYALPMMGALAWLTRQGGTTIGTAFGLRRAPVGRVLISGLLLHFLEWTLMVVITLALTRLGFEYGLGDAEEAKEAAGSVLVLTNDVVWAPMGEELWFRGLLYTCLRTRFGVAPSAIVTAALFSLFHYPETLERAATLFLPAILSSLWYERTRSLWPNMVSHSLNNTLVTVFHAGG